MKGKIRDLHFGSHLILFTVPLALIGIVVLPGVVVSDASIFGEFTATIGAILFMPAIFILVTPEFRTAEAGCLSQSDLAGCVE